MLNVMWRALAVLRVLYSADIMHVQKGAYPYNHIQQKTKKGPLICHVIVKHDFKILDNTGNVPEGHRCPSLVAQLRKLKGKLLKPSWMQTDSMPFHYSYGVRNFKYLYQCYIRTLFLEKQLSLDTIGIISIII